MFYIFTVQQTGHIAASFLGSPGLFGSHCDCAKQRTRVEAKQHRSPLEYQLISVEIKACTGAACMLPDARVPELYPEAL